MDDNVVNIEGDDFSILQSVIGKVGGKSLLNDTDSNNEFNTKSKAASRIAEKMKKARERLAKVKAQEAGSAQPENGKGFLYKYIKVVATKTANSLDQVTDMTLYQINTLMKAYLAWEAYDIDVRSRLSMFSSGNKKELVHWSDES